MVIYRYSERIGEFLLPPIFCITYTVMKKYYTGEPINIHIQSSINIILENNRIITTKKREVQITNISWRRRKGNSHICPGANTPFTLEPILLELEGGRYMSPILLGALAEVAAAAEVVVIASEATATAAAREATAEARSAAAVTRRIKY